MRNTLSKNTRLILLSAGLAVCTTSARAQSDIIIKYYSGTDQSYSIQASGKLAFSNTDLLITPVAGSSVTTIPLNIIRKIVFGTSSNPTSVPQTQAGADAIMIYPNPASGSFSISAGDAKRKSVKVFNPTGQQVLSGNYAAGESIAISMLSPGIYIVSVDNKMFKLVKY